MTHTPLYIHLLWPTPLQCYRNVAIAFNSTSVRMSPRWKTATLFPFAAVAQRFLPAVMRRWAGKQQGCCRC